MEIVIDQLNSLGTAEPLQTAMLEENMRCTSQALSGMFLQLLLLLSFFKRRVAPLMNVTVHTLLRQCSTRYDRFAVVEVSDACCVRVQGQHAVAHDSDAAAAAHERRDSAPYRLLCTLCHGMAMHLHHVSHTMHS